MTEAAAPEDLPDRIVAVLEEADADGTVSVGHIQRLLARDGLDVASSVIRETAEELVAEDRLVKELGPKYGLPE